MIGHAREAVATRDAADTLLALVRAEGTAAHLHPVSDALVKGPEAARNVADIVHLLCLLHGRHPSVVDHAVVQTTNLETRAFLNDAANAFADERAALSKLVVAVGPLPSTPGQADTETTVLAQHHAIEMLAQSERSGCALGAAVAVIVDWAAIRIVLDMAAKRLSIELTPSRLPSESDIASALRSGDNTPAADRAMMFGAQQILAQHRGLWDLLEARAVARSDY